MSNFNISVKFDSKVRSAKMYFCSRNLKNLKLHGEPFQHWALKFEFVDGIVMYVEADLHQHDSDECKFSLDSKIVPSITHKPCGEFKEEMVKEVVISPTKVIKAAMSNKHNFTPYSLLSNNCQSWVMETLDLLDCPDTTKGLSSIQKILNKVSKGISVVGPSLNMAAITPSVAPEVAIALGSSACVSESAKAVVDYANKTHKIE